MAHRETLVRGKPLNKWSGFVVILIVLLAVFSFAVYKNSLSAHSGSSPTTKALQTSTKSFGLAYTVSRTHTSKNNIVVNNLWRKTEIISGGYQNACAVSNGQAFCWGDGVYGKLGNGSTSPQLSPVAVTQAAGILGSKKVSNISAGTFHTCAIANAQAFCWGYNGNGRLGNGGTTDSPNPVIVTAAAGGLFDKAVTHISAGGDHTCAIANAQAFCWGSGTNGKLGNSSTLQQTTPVAVTRAVGVLSGKSVTDISAGGDHTCAIANAQAYCWGNGTDGRLGNSGVGNSSAPVAVTQAVGVLSGKSVTSISVGQSHSCAIADGQAFCWGNGGSGRLGDGLSNSSSAPVAVTQASGYLAGKIVTSISTGGEHTCAIANAQAYCWGSGLNGRLGDGLSNNRSTPVAVNVSGVFAGKTISNIKAASHNSCAIANGRAYCWGWNNYGQLGEGTTVLQKLAPQRVNDSYY